LVRGSDLVVQVKKSELSQKLIFAFALITAGQNNEETLELLNYNDSFPKNTEIVNSGK